MHRVIQIEFNELSPTLIDEFISAGELPNFRRLRDSSEVFVTDASDEMSLEPWTQWPTLHTGIPDRVHGIQHLGEANRIAGRGVAYELAGAGFKVGVFGTMNLDYGPLEGFVVPDPWNPDSDPHPAGIAAFTAFVSSAVQENSAGKLDKRAAFPFLRYLASHGLTLKTAALAARQLIDERRDAGLKWRRSLVLDAISYDVFRNLVRHHNVDYATFFSNSTAHFQHYFWRNFRPEDFSVPPAPEDHPSVADAMLIGYRNYDRLVGRFLDDFADYRLVFATALSQEPWDTTKCMYRPKNFDRLLQLLGLDSTRVSVTPVMAEEFLLTFSDETAAEEAMTRVNAAQIGDQPLFRTQPVEALRAKVGCAVADWSPNHGAITLPDGTEVPFAELFTRVHTIRSGRHHPDGCFWVQSSTPRNEGDRIPLTAVAPTILRLFGVSAPTYMEKRPVELVCHSR